MTFFMSRTKNYAQLMVGLHIHKTRWKNIVHLICDQNSNIQFTIQYSCQWQTTYLSAKTVQSINFSHKVTFANSTKRWITWHFTYSRKDNKWLILLKVFHYVKLWFLYTRSLVFPNVLFLPYSKWYYTPVGFGDHGIRTCISIKPDSIVSKTSEQTVGNFQWNW